MSLAVPSSTKFMFRKNRQNLPIPGSNSKRSVLPFGNWTIVTTIIDGPSQVQRVRFPGNKRYFVLLDNQGRIIDGSLLQSTQVPSSSYLEVFANGVITIADDSATNSGAIPDSFDDIKDIPVLVSSDFLQNGYKYYVAV